MNIQLKINIIHIPNPKLEVEQLGQIDHVIEEKINRWMASKNIHFSDNWTHSFWKIFSDQSQELHFKKPKKLTKSQLTEYYCWIPAQALIETADSYSLYWAYLEKAMSIWLPSIFPLSETDFEGLWKEVRKELS
jgi:hypothetical protein